MCCRLPCAILLAEAKMIRLLVADDDAGVRRGLRMALGLEPDIVVVGEAASGQGVLDMVAAANPDVVVMDLSMPGMDGVAATSALLASPARCPVVMLSMVDDADSRRRAFAAGATAYVQKGAGLDPLLAAIRSAGARFRAAKTSPRVC
jgi:DNA-binding NarL/FixJ family response regulator